MYMFSFHIALHNSKLCPLSVNAVTTVFEHQHDNEINTSPKFVPLFLAAGEVYVSFAQCICFDNVFTLWGSYKFELARIFVALNCAAPYSKVIVINQYDAQFRKTSISLSFLHFFCSRDKVHHKQDTFLLDMVKGVVFETTLLLLSYFFMMAYFRHK